MAKLLEVLICPVTRGALTYDREKQELISKKAGLAFPIKSGVPILLVEKARQAPDMQGSDLVKEVTCQKPMLWENGRPVPLERDLDLLQWPDKPGFRVVAIDYGIKYNILRSRSCIF